MRRSGAGSLRQPCFWYRDVRTAGAPETERWLERHGIIADGLFMRRAGDRRKDTVVKREIYERHIAGHYTVRVVFDDRDQVVRLWRDELDLPCFQVAWGNF